jgi:uncharacterized protein (DUF427 family)
MISVKDQRPKEKQVKLPGADHPISIQPNPARVVISVAGRVVADSPSAEGHQGISRCEATYLRVRLAFAARI